MAKVPQPPCDKSQIEQAAALFLAPGSVTELRILGSSYGTVSGYYDDPQALSRDAAHWSGKAEGVYLMPNPVEPALLARSCNHVIVRAKKTTTDKDILRRCFLLIDCDAERPTGISSTDEQHDQARARARKIRGWLRRLGFPEPVLADSGNGAHLVYAIDLPNDDASRDLIKRVLQALAFRFNGDGVVVDESTYNAARVWKCYGTLCCKGDSMPDRPHRLARLLEVPETLALVPRQLLEVVAAQVPALALPKHKPNGNGVDVEHWIAEHQLEVREPAPWQGGRRWIFKTCPWNSDHTDRSAYIVQFPSGAPAAGCHHHGCKSQGRDWHALRDAVEPGWRDRSNGYSSSNGNGKAAASEVREEEAEYDAPSLPHQDTVLPFPVDALPDALSRLVSEGAAALCCPPDFVAVPMLTLLAGTIGTSRAIHIKEQGLESPCIYSAVVAATGSKKSPGLKLAARPLYALQDRYQMEYEQALEVYRQEQARYEQEEAVWKEALKRAARGDGKVRYTPPRPPEEPVLRQVLANDATMEAIAGLLHRTPRGVVYIHDELTSWALGMNQYRNGKGSDRQHWLSIWSGNQVMINRKGQKEALYLRDPLVCVTGCLPPDVLSDLTDSRGREDGFVHRILFACPDYMRSRWSDATVSPETMAAYERIYTALRELQPVRDGQGMLQPVILSFAPSGRAVFVDWIMAHQAEMDDPDFSPLLRGPWSKMEGYCARLALVIHLCRLAAGEVIADNVDKVSALAAATLIGYFKSHARRVYAQLTKTAKDQDVEQALAWIADQGGEVTARDVLRRRLGGVKTKDQARGLLRELEQRAYGRLREGDRSSWVFTLATAGRGAESA